MATGLRMLLTALLLCVAQNAAAAEPLPDPTRPSIDLDSSGAGGAADVVPDEAVPRGLQSIIISPQYRAAIINGETVSLGGKYGDSKLVEVRENSVVLRNAQGRRVLELFPRVSIRKNEAVRHEGAAQEKTSGQTNLPERDAGGIK
jgi:MSHA biogenesis protein MshK